jgi:hypothetical protein
MMIQLRVTAICSSLAWLVYGCADTLYPIIDPQQAFDQSGFIGHRIVHGSLLVMTFFMRSMDFPALFASPVLSFPAGPVLTIPALLPIVASPQR